MSNPYLLFSSCLFQHRLIFLSIVQCQTSSLAKDQAEHLNSPFFFFFRVEITNVGPRRRERGGLEKRERLLNKKYELQRRERESSFYRQAPHFPCTPHVPTHNFMAYMHFNMMFLAGILRWSVIKWLIASL